MKYLNLEQLAKVDECDFLSKRPFPWTNPEGLLYEDAYSVLAENLPEVDICEKSFDKARSHGQESHDRYSLEYAPGLDIAEPWEEFIEELRSDEYRNFLERLYGRDAFKLRFHWHYAPSGASVSPHCDSAQKVGSHLFYFNPSDSWDVSWGGGTWVLDDVGRFHRSSSPDFEDFDNALQSDFQGNTSFIFRRTAHSWHGVKEIRCPADQLRKVFIVVVDGWRFTEKIRSMALRPGAARY